MAQSTEMNTSAPMPSHTSFRLQMEGMVSAMIYALCFSWFHLDSGGELVNTRILTVFLIGLIVVPALSAMPMVLLRRMLLPLLEKQSGVVAFMPFTRFALYALQGIVVWVATREAYAWYFGSAAIL